MTRLLFAALLVLVLVEAVMAFRFITPFFGERIAVPGLRGNTGRALFETLLMFALWFAVVLPFAAIWRRRLPACGHPSWWAEFPGSVALFWVVAMSIDKLLVAHWMWDTRNWFKGLLGGGWDASVMEAPLLVSLLLGFALTVLVEGGSQAPKSSRNVAELPATLAGSPSASTWPSRSTTT